MGKTGHFIGTFNDLLKRTDQIALGYHNLTKDGHGRTLGSTKLARGEKSDAQSHPVRWLAALGNDGAM